MSNRILKPYLDRYQFWSIELAIPKVVLRDHSEKIREEIEYFVEQMKRIHNCRGKVKSNIKVKVLLKKG